MNCDGFKVTKVEIPSFILKGCKWKSLNILNLSFIDQFGDFRLGLLYFPPYRQNSSEALECMHARVSGSPLEDEDFMLISFIWS